MDLLACCLLRRESNHAQLKHAFQLLKYHKQPKMLNVSFRDPQAFTNLNSMPPVEIENKELYLSYMEDVLKKKQKELFEFEESLSRVKRQNDQLQASRRIVQPLQLTRMSQILNKKLMLFQQLIGSQSSKYPQLMLNQDYKQLTHNLNLIEQTCNLNYNNLKQELLHYHQELSSQKEQLNSKLSKLQELQSYEKYLTELQRILQHKQFSIIQHQQRIKSVEEVKQSNQSQHNDTISLHPQNMQYDTFSAEHQQSLTNHSVSLRKRSRIFDAKVPKESHRTSAHKQSSQIMQERSIGDQPHIHFSAIPHIIEEFPAEEKQTQNTGVQTFFSSPREEATQFIHKQAKYLKFIKLWIKYSQRKAGGPPQHKLTMTLYRWRLNALYQEGIQESAEEILLWPHKLQKMGNFSSLNYSQLTLKKQKYLQQFFDFQRRKFQRQKIITFLRSILKNKNRKERIPVLLYFRRYRQNARTKSIYKIMPSHVTSQSQALRDLTTHCTHSTGQQMNLTNSQINRESRLQTHSSGFFEQPLKLSQSKSRSSKQTAIPPNLVKFKGKENTFDIQKLKQYIKSQQQVEAKLAIQCAQTQSVFRTMSTLKRVTSRLQNGFLMRLIRHDENSRVQILQKAVSGYEFRWQLFMAKARLGLTSNNNKISHLEQLLSYACPPEK